MKDYRDIILTDYPQIRLTEGNLIVEPMIESDMEEVRTLAEGIVTKHSGLFNYDFVMSAITPGALRWVIRLNGNNKIIGSVYLSKFEDVYLRMFVPEITYFLDGDYTNNGYCRNAVKMVLDYVFNTTDIETMYARVSEGNTDSIKLVKVLQFEFKPNSSYYIKKKPGL